MIDKKRSIFAFWDGRRLQRVDPLVVYRQLSLDPEFNWDEDPKLIDSGDEKMSLAAMQRTASAVRRSFGVGEYDGRQGMTEAECVQLLVTFCEAMQTLKKNTSLSPISREPTESGSSDVESATKSASACG